MPIQTRVIDVERLEAVVALRIILFFSLFIPSLGQAEIILGYSIPAYEACLTYIEGYCSSLSNESGTYSNYSRQIFTSTEPGGNNTVTYFYKDIVTCQFVSTVTGETVLSGEKAGCSKSYVMSLSDIPNQNDRRSPQPVNKCGSIIDVDNLALGEAVPLIGSGDQLVYSTNRVRGRSFDYVVRIPVLKYPDQVQSGVKIRLRVAGKEFFKTYTAGEIVPNLTWDYLWDGKDNLGQEVMGATMAEVTYLDVGAPSNKETIASYTFPLGGWHSRSMGLGGFMLSSHHFYDPIKHWIYMGDGSIHTATAQLKYMDDNDKLREPIPGGSEVYNVLVVSSQDASLAYLFDPQTGHHLKTMSARSGKVLKSFSYNTQGELSLIEDAFGNQTTINRPSNSVVQIQAPHNQVTTLTLNAYGWAEQIESPGLKKYLITYKDEQGLMASFKKPGGAVSTFTYDSSGLLVKDQSTAGSFWDLVYSINQTTQKKSIMMTSAEGRTYSYTVDPQVTVDSSIRTEVSPGGATRVVNYSPVGQTKSTEAHGLVSQVYHSPDARFNSMASFDANSFIYSPYSPNNRTITTTKTSNYSNNDFLRLSSESIVAKDNLQHTWTTNYDGTTGKYSVISPEGRSSSQTLNELDQPISYQVGSYLPTHFTYDSLGRLSLVDQGGRTASFVYNSQGFVSEVKNSLNQIVQYEYSLDGQVLKQILPDGKQVNYRYDAGGNLKSIKPPGRPKHNFIYNLFDLVSSYFPPDIVEDSGATHYSYNLDRQITSITKPGGAQVQFGYEPVSGLLHNITTPEGIYTRAYNSANQMISLNSPQNIGLSWQYDTFMLKNQTLTTPWTTAQLNYVYDRFLPKEETLNSADTSHTITFAYDRDDLLTRAGDLNLTRDPLSGVVTNTQLNNVQEQFTYNTFGEVASYEVTYSNAPIFKEIYTRDSLGRIIQKDLTIDGTTTHYQYVYDSNSRLKQVWTNDTLTRTYTYDANSNRIKVEEGTRRIKATYDTQDRMLSYGARLYTYTAQGDRLLRYNENNENQVQYSYDSMGALTKAIRTTKAQTGLPVTDTFDYAQDGLGRRIERKKNGSVQERYVYDSAGRLIAELKNNNSQILTRYVYATKAHVPDYMIKKNVNYKLIHDQLGSIRLIINSNTGEIVSRMDYDEFGQIEFSISPNFQPLGFAGGIRDNATGLVRFGARDYDPKVGRWTSKDPILFAGGDVNLYGYVLQDPVNFVDPSGRLAFLVSGAIGAGFGLTAGAITAYYNGASIGQGALIGAATGFAIGSGAGLLAEGAALAGVGFGGQTFSGAVGGAIGGFTGSLLSQTIVTGSPSLSDAGAAAIGGAAGGACGPVLGGGAAAEFTTGVVLFPTNLISGAQH